MLDRNSAIILTPPKQSPWTDAKIARLKEMHSAGVGYSAIGAALGFGRGAISGKVDRLGLVGRPRAARRTADPAAKDRSTKQRIAKMLKVRSPSNGGVVMVESIVREEGPQPAEFLGITFADLENGQCKFPRGEGASITFCGQPRLAGKPYCESCCGIAYSHPLTAASTARAQTADALRRAFRRMIGLTPKQRQLYDFIAAEIARRGFAPSYDEMADGIGAKGKGNIARLVMCLEQRGVIRRIPNRARAIEIIGRPAQSSVTLNSEILTLTDKYAAEHQISRDTAVNEALRQWFGATA